MIYNPAILFAQCFIDGVDVSMVNSGPNPLSTPITITASNLYLGRRGLASYYFNGNIANFRMWNTVRTQQEINDNMHIDVNGGDFGLIAYAKLDEGMGTIAGDSSNNANNGNIVDAVWEVEDGSLPVELSSFTAILTSTDTAEIKWISQTETNLLGYNVLRCEADAVEQAQKVNSAIITANNSTQTSSYSFC